MSPLHALGETRTTAPRGIEVSRGFTSVKEKQQAVSGAAEGRCTPSEAIRTLRLICGRFISKPLWPGRGPSHAASMT